MRKLLYLYVLSMLAGCTLPLIGDEESSVPETKRSVHILTRSASDISYPLALYAFNTEDGTLVASDTQLTKEDDLSFALSAGDYYLVALAGYDGCTVPASPTLSSIITAPSNGISKTPMQMGSASVQVTQNATVSITLYNQVAAVDLALYDIPTDATAVSTSLSLMASGISFDGKYTGNAAATVELVKEDDMWTMPLFYTLPNNGERLTLSITTTTPSGTQTYGYTHSSPLKANTPYTLSGSFIEGFTVNGSITLAGWNEAENIAFTFGSENDGDEIPDTLGNPEVVYQVEGLPEIGTLWNGHFVVGILDSDEENITSMLLLSTSEWTGVTSSLNEETPSMAADIASTYTEGKLTGWCIPTRREASKICAMLGDTILEETNAFLEANEIVPLSIGTDNDTGNTIRYLCDDAKFTFKWDSEGAPSKAGSKRGYHLRLVNSVRFRVTEK